MKISTKGRYGLRALVDLAVYSQGEPTALAMVAVSYTHLDVYKRQEPN